MEPDPAIVAMAAIETHLRDLSRAVLAAQYGKDWLEQVLDEVTLTGLRQRREEDQGRHPDAVPHDLLAYMHVDELRLLLHDHWGSFQPLLGREEDFSSIMEMAQDFGRLAQDKQSGAWQTDIYVSMLRMLATEIHMALMRFNLQQGWLNMGKPVE